jgi:hypothetical protein
MHLAILSPNQEKLLPFLSNFKDDFTLVGGTAIALQIGHRQSIDFDLFSLKKIQNQKILRIFKKNNLEIQKIFQNNPEELSLMAQNVRFTFFHYPFPIDFREKIENYIKCPNLLTLAAMKAYALSRRNKWKDYVDFYFLIKNHFTLEEISIHTKKIFKNEFNERILREALSYFQDIDYSEQVAFMDNWQTSDKKIKEYLRKVSIK